MRITSSAFTDGGFIPEDYCCTGRNINPPLEIRDIPGGTETLALSMVDLDDLMVHWLVWNIDPTSSTYTRIYEGNLPSGAAEGRNSFGGSNYHGPCPDDDVIHRYQITVYALNDSLALGDNYELDDVEVAMEDNIITTAQINCRYDAGGTILG